MNKHLILIIAFTMIVGCQKNEEITSEKKDPIAIQTLGINDLMNPNNIAIQISFIEKKFSLAPKSKTDNGAIYEYENCEIELSGDEKGNITSIVAYVTNPKCSFETIHGNSKNITLEKLITQDRQHNYQSRILVNCVNSCGHTREPEYIYLSHGASVNGNIATAFIATSVDGAYEWEEKVKSILKIDNLDDDEFINCTNKFDKLAMDYFKGGKISSVEISAANSIYFGKFPIGCK